MEIEPISSSSSTTTDRWRQLLAQQAQVRSEHATQPQTEAPLAPSTPATDGVDVKFDRHAGTGAQMVRLVESETGRVISEIPSQRVLDLVASLIEQNKTNQRGGGNDGQH